MKLFILSPNRDAVFTPELLSSLSKNVEVVSDTVPKPLREVTGLFEAGEKILAMDPDFCDWKFPSELLKDMPDLKAICLQTTSFSWIDVAEAARLGVPVVNLRGFSAEAVAEYALFMALATVRKFPIVMQDGFKQDFVKHQGMELKGKRVGIIGLGRIGSRIAELCAGFGMEVVYWSKATRDERFSYKELSEVTSTSDIIFPTVAQNEETAGLITDEMIESMKTNAVFVSVVHKVYNHDLLLSQVASGSLYGYAFEGDNEDPGNYKGNVFAVPAIAWATDGSMRANGEMWTSAILSAVKGEYPTKIN